MFLNSPGLFLPWSDPMLPGESWKWSDVMFVVMASGGTGCCDVVIYGKGLHSGEKVGRRAGLYLVDFCGCKIRKSVRDMTEVRCGPRLRFGKTAWIGRDLMQEFG
jgi:hypothetical protein